MDLGFGGFPISLEALSQMRPKPRRMTGETDEAYTFSLILPGVQSENIQVNIVDDKLSIKASSNLPSSSYEYEESFKIPTQAIQSEMKAETKDGVLTVVIPKAPEAPAAKIEVERKIERDPSAYELVYQVPGIGPEKVKVEIKTGELVVGADAGPHSFFKTFERKYLIPDDAEADRIRAFCENGLFIVSIPKVTAVDVPVKDDIGEHEDWYSIHLRLPGLPKENIKLERIAGRFSLKIFEEKDSHDDEHVYEHAFTVPKYVEAENVVSEFKNGVLTVAGPVHHSEKKHVPVITG